jgi:uncharacterized protein YbaP (TraB family)
VQVLQASHLKELQEREQQLNNKSAQVQAMHLTQLKHVLQKHVLELLEAENERAARALLARVEAEEALRLEHGEDAEQRAVPVGLGG